MSITVDIAERRRDVTAFIRLAHAVYADDPLWTAPLEREVRRTLDARRNPYYRTATLRLFLARRDGVPAARIAVTISRAHEARWGERAAFFGFFESASDVEAAEAVLHAAEQYAEVQGAVAIEGPFNPCHYSELGMQCDAYDGEHRFFQPHNPAWYNDFFRAHGYNVSSRKLTMRNDDCRTLRREPAMLRAPGDAGALRADAADANVHAGADVPAGSGDFTVRTFDMRRKAADLEAMRAVFNDAFSDNWHFLLSTAEEFRFSADMIEYITDPDLILFLEERGEPVGVLLLVYDVNPLLRLLHGRVHLAPLLLWQRRKRRLRGIMVYAVGIRPQQRGSRGYALLLTEGVRIAARFDTVEATWISEENRAAIAAARHLGMHEDRHFVIYRKEVRS